MEFTSFLFLLASINVCRKFVRKKIMLPSFPLGKLLGKSTFYLICVLFTVEDWPPKVPKESVYLSLKLPLLPKCAWNEYLQGWSKHCTIWDVSSSSRRHLFGIVWWQFGCLEKCNLWSLPRSDCYHWLTTVSRKRERERERERDWQNECILSIVSLRMHESSVWVH